MHVGRLSASKISTFKTCPLQYYAKYELKLRDEAGPAAWVGTAVHSVLEYIVKHKKVPDIKAICIANKVPNEIKLVKDLALKTIKNGYLVKPEIIVDVEYEFKVQLNDKVQLYGFIDRLDIEGDKATIIDIKTGKKPYTKKELANNYQAKLYSIACKKDFPEIKTIDVIFWFVRNQERQLLEFNLSDIKKFETEVISIYNDIEQCVEPMPTKFKWCSYCIYNDQCPLFKPSNGEGLKLKPSF